MTENEPLPVGLVGCGNIFERYVNGLRRFGHEVEVVWCADIDVRLAERRAKELDVPKAGSPADAAADRLGFAALVVNLTPPAAHASVTRQFLLAGKHVYTEKPLATSLRDAQELLGLASRQSLSVGGAPDWFLGRTARTARGALTRGEIGEPLAFSAFITHNQVESWHPNPAIFFQPGAGPVLDLGPYYVSALVDSLGPVRSLAAVERTGEATRLVTAPGRVVDSITVEVPTHSTAILEMESGVIGTLTMSFEAWERNVPFIDIYGTGATLSLPMPLERDAPVRVKRHEEDAWRELELVQGTDYVRGMGVADMARSVRAGAVPAASGERAYHVLEVLSAVGESNLKRKFIPISSTYQEK
jgi:predicted dehydrogenase